MTPDLHTVKTWKRLEQGSHSADDLQLLRHEHFEARFEGIFRTDYDATHTAANRSGRFSEQVRDERSNYILDPDKNGRYLEKGEKMGVHLLLEKDSETEYSVTYKYDFYSSKITGSDFGIVEFNHQKETYNIIKERKGDVDHSMFNRVLIAILREWKKGSFPDRTDWAS